MLKLSKSNLFLAKYAGGKHSTRHRLDFMRVNIPDAPDAPLDKSLSNPQPQPQPQPQLRAPRAPRATISAVTESSLYISELPLQPLQRPLQSTQSLKPMPGHPDSNPDVTAQSTPLIEPIPFPSNDFYASTPINPDTTEFYLDSEAVNAIAKIPLPSIVPYVQVSELPQPDTPEPLTATHSTQLEPGMPGHPDSEQVVTSDPGHLPEHPPNPPVSYLLEANDLSMVSFAPSKTPHRITWPDVATLIRLSASAQGIADAPHCQPVKLHVADLAALIKIFKAHEVQHVRISTLDNRPGSAPVTFENLTGTIKAYVMPQPEPETESEPEEE